MSQRPQGNGRHSLHETILKDGILDLWERRLTSTTPRFGASDGIVIIASHPTERDEVRRAGRLRIVIVSRGSRDTFFVIDVVAQVLVQLHNSSYYISIAMSTSKPQDNPYLAHLPPHQRGVGSTNSDPSAKEPLYGFVPRHVKGEQARKAMVSLHQESWG